MILLFHIFVAISSLVLSGITYLRPTKSKLHISYGLVVVTFITGFYMVFSKPVHILNTCITGLVYLGIVSMAIFSAQRKLRLSANEITE